MNRRVSKSISYVIFGALFCLTLSLSIAITNGQSQNSFTKAAAPAKLPVTTKSDEAKTEFLTGRQLSENLRAQDSLQHFDKAIELDPGFASAELARANSSATTKEFFEHLKKAVAMAPNASEGERLQILAVEAGSNGETVKQKEYLMKLVSAFPGDERANFALGNYYFGQQDIKSAIDAYRKSATINPDYAPVYNLLGYAYRQAEDFKAAEKSFKRYIELIPTDPNPYDSYAELLLKMGSFDDSITQYRKALSISPTFNNSHMGIAANLMYSGKSDDALAELDKLTENAQSDGDRRLALFAKAVVYSDKWDLAKAAEMFELEYKIAEKNQDPASMSADLQAKAIVLVQAAKYDDAQWAFDQSLKIVSESSLNDKIKENAKLVHHFNIALVLIGRDNFTAAREEVTEYTKGANEKRNPVQIKLAHQLNGTLALAQKNYDVAIAEFLQASDQNPQNLFRLSLAYRGKGDKKKAWEYCEKAAKFNSLPQLPYAFVRVRAQKDLQSMNH